MHAIICAMYAVLALVDEQRSERASNVNDYLLRGMR